MNSVYFQLAILSSPKIFKNYTSFPIIVHVILNNFGEVSLIMDNTSLIHNKFSNIWPHFLLFEIRRSQTAVKTWGSANGYLIFQVIAWHHILILTVNMNSELRDEALDLWYKFSKTGFESNSALSYTLISELTSLSIETVRRQVKKLEQNNWVSYSKKEGVRYSASEENNKYLADTFNVKEIQNFGKLLDLIDKNK